jgi:mannose-6-phosphate isomerase
MLEIVDPLVFDSYYRPQVWGGRGLLSVLGRELPTDGPYGEAWEVSPHKLHVSQIAEGPLAGQNLNDLWKTLNTANPNQREFPLLIKWLECRELLSLQVHPDDAMAHRVLKEPNGKSEAWVIIGVEPTARVYAGIKPGVTREMLQQHLQRGTLTECLHTFTPKVGDCISLPAGTIHAAGGGVIFAEVQQSSDATFRLYDWDRPGLDGKPRPLQIEMALEATNWNQGPISPVVPVQIPNQPPGVRGEQLVDGNGFRMKRYSISDSFPCPHEGELSIWMVLDGTGELTNAESGYRRQFTKGSTTVVPPGARRLSWKTASSNPTLTLLCATIK